MTFPALRLATTDALEDGHTVVVTDKPGDQVMLVGTRPLPEHRAEARRIVREGMADVLAWLGEPVEPPTGASVVAGLRSQRGIAVTALPTSNRAFPSDSLHWMYAKPEPINWATIGDSPIGPTATPITLTAQRFGYRQELPPAAQGSDDDIIRAVRGAVRSAYRQAADSLVRHELVADVTDGYPFPTVRVELAFKAWPAVPGVTVPDEADR